MKLTDEQKRGNPLRVTIGGVPVEDQAAGIKAFKEACCPRPAFEFRVVWSTRHRPGYVVYCHHFSADDSPIHEHVATWLVASFVQECEARSYAKFRNEYTSVTGMRDLK